jgi:hypothetical protein
VIIVYETSYQALKYCINKSENLLIETGNVPSSKKNEIQSVRRRFESNCLCSLLVVCISGSVCSRCSSCKLVYSSSSRKLFDLKGRW